jgi:hypothetical protein
MAKAHNPGESLWLGVSEEFTKEGIELLMGEKNLKPCILEEPPQALRWLCGVEGHIGGASLENGEKAGHQEGGSTQEGANAHFSRGLAGGTGAGTAIGARISTLPKPRCDFLTLLQQPSIGPLSVCLVMVAVNVAVNVTVNVTVIAVAGFDQGDPVWVFLGTRIQLQPEIHRKIGGGMALHRGL